MLLFLKCFAPGLVQWCTVRKLDVSPIVPQGTVWTLHVHYSIQVIKTLMLLVLPLIGWLKTISYLIGEGMLMVTLRKYIFFISEQWITHLFVTLRWVKNELTRITCYKMLGVYTQMICWWWWWCCWTQHKGMKRQVIST